MKKFLALTTALLLCFALSFADSIPSKTTGDMTKVDTVVTTQPNASITIVNTESAAASEDHQAAVETCNTEIQKLVKLMSAIELPAPSVDGASTEEAEVAAAKARTEAIVTYFGNVTTVEDTAVELTEMLQSETVTVDEFFPLVASGFEKDCGKATLTLSVSTPYAADAKVVALIGQAADAVENVEWTAFETAITGEGQVQVELPEETLLFIQATTTLMALVSE